MIKEFPKASPKKNVCTSKNFHLSGVGVRFVTRYFLFGIQKAD